MTRPIGKAGRASERALSKRMGGQLTAASGAVGDKGDVKLGRYLLEAKSTSQKSFGLSLAILIKIAREAAMSGRFPAVAITFTTPAGEAKPYGRWVAIPEDEFKELMELTDEVRRLDR